MKPTWLSFSSIGRAGVIAGASSTSIDSNQPSRARVRTSFSIFAGSNRSPTWEVICAATAAGEMRRNPAKRILVESRGCYPYRDGGRWFDGVVECLRQDWRCGQHKRPDTKHLLEPIHEHLSLHRGG